MPATRHPLHLATFRNSFVEELPGEIAPHNRPRQVPGCCYSRIEPTPVSSSQLLAWSDDLADFLALEQPQERDETVDALGGNLITSTMKPFAARYGGHQFGSWAGQLGDGRAITLGELEASDGSWWELQLKGAGPTPYSRRADGRAVLRSSLREFLCSEAMHALGVPTTRALSLVGTADMVVRDMFYDGNARPEKGAIVARVAPSFIRFGNFEMMAAAGEDRNLRALADYTIRHLYPELGEPSNAVYVQWFEEVCRRTAVMIAHWMTVGFVHGVMNTDNMSILGLTIDYGPYGWLEPYEPQWTPNTTDFGQRRYAFGQQPRVALWNLAMLGSALIPLVSKKEELEGALELYRSTYFEAYHAMMLQKLGLTPLHQEGDASLIEDLTQSLVESEMDMTRFFRKLSSLTPELAEGQGGENLLLQQLIEDASYAELSAEAHPHLQQWFGNYALRLRKEAANPELIQQGMFGVNPKYVLRNYLAQQAIDGVETGDLSLLETLMRVLRTPFTEHPEQESLAAKRPEWARNKPGCATLSCSS
ncbi:YdiU family protein [bacterium]|nr:MAG: YdiU family protein [bacterium]